MTTLELVEEGNVRVLSTLTEHLRRRSSVACSMLIASEQFGMLMQTFDRLSLWSPTHIIGRTIKEHGLIRSVSIIIGRIKAG